MLLLLVMLKHSDETGRFSVDMAARCFAAFYRLRRAAGFLYEKRRGAKSAVVDNPDTSAEAMRRMVKMNPFRRFEREGLLDLSEDGRYFVVNPALFAALTPAVREQLWEIAIKRMVEHFGGYLESIRVWVEKAIG